MKSKLIFLMVTVLLVTVFSPGSCSAATPSTDSLIKVLIAVTAGLFFTLFVIVLFFAEFMKMRRRVGHY